MPGAIMYFLIWVFCWPLRRLIWNWRVEGRENLLPRGQGMVLAVNHVHWLDIVILGASLPLSHRPVWIAKTEVLSNRFTDWWFRQMGVIPIKRGQRDIAALNAAEQALKDGVVLAIFPEGHRSRGKGLLEGRGGGVRLAIRSGSPIVPIAIWGTEVGIIGAIRRKPIRIRIGQPYHPQSESSKIPWDRMNQLTNEMMMHIAELMPEQYWGAYREHVLTARTASEG